MKLFQSIIKAIEYHTHCPLCSQKLEINDRDLADEHGYAVKHGYPRLTFYLDILNQDTITIDPYTNEVTMSITDSSSIAFTPGFGGAIATYVAPPAKPYTIKNGLFMHSLMVNCNSCCQFSFVLQVHIDLGTTRHIGTYLNSETISIEDDGIVHEVKNIYAVKQTSYSSFAKDGTSRKTILPLIDLDIKNPLETISRIRKLLIFS